MVICATLSPCNTHTHTHTDKLPKQSTVKLLYHCLNKRTFFFFVVVLHCFTSNGSDFLKFIKKPLHSDEYFDKIDFYS